MWREAASALRSVQRRSLDLLINLLAPMAAPQPSPKQVVGPMGSVRISNGPKPGRHPQRRLPSLDHQDPFQVAVARLLGEYPETSLVPLPDPISRSRPVPSARVSNRP